MPLSAEDQFRKRARRALEAGRPFSARGDVNQAILEEVRREWVQCVGDSAAAPRASESLAEDRPAAPKQGPMAVCPDCTKEVPLFMVRMNDACNDCFEAWLIAHPPPRPERTRRVHFEGDVHRQVEAMSSFAPTDCAQEAPQPKGTCAPVRLAPHAPNPHLEGDTKLRCEDCFNTLKHTENECVFCGKTRAELQESAGITRAVIA